LQQLIWYLAESSGVTFAMPPGFLDGGENGENPDK